MEKLLGNDISFYNDINNTIRKVDFNKMIQAGSNFCIIRTSFGTYIDEDFSDFWKSCKSVFLPRGAYGFLTYETSPEVQAQNLLRALGTDIGDLPISVDFEKYKKNGVYWMPSYASEYLKRYLDVIEIETGKIPIIYTGYYIWLQFGTPSLEWKRYKLWLAAYGVDNPLIPKPWDKMTFHQFGQLSGTVFGAESSLIDANYYFGTYEDFANEFDIGLEKPVHIPISKPEGFVFSAIDTMNVRRLPTTSSVIVRKILPGEFIVAKDVSGTDSWIKIGDGEWVCVAKADKRYLIKE